RRCLSSIHLMRHGQQFWENPEYSLHIEILCSCESSNGKIRDEWEVRMMRKVTFGGASSLDNYIARPDEAVDWLVWSDDVQEIMAAYWRTIDTILWGRKTYEFALRSSKGKTGGYPGMKNYVFSRGLKPKSDESVTIVSTDAAAFVRDLKQQDGKDI